MTRHYSTREFFRQMPNALLARYFHAHDLFGDLDFLAMKETQPDTLFEAWLELPDGQRNAMDAEFLDIFEMSCESGCRAILDEAEWHLAAEPQAHTEFVDKLAALTNHYERAMVTFLDHNRFWNGATLFHHADTRTYWRKRKNLPHQLAAVHEDGRREWPILSAITFTIPRHGATIAWWKRSAVVIWITSLPIPKTIRNKASSGLTASLTADRIIQPLKLSMSTHKRTAGLT